MLFNKALRDQLRKLVAAHGGLEPGAGGGFMGKCRAELPSGNHTKSY